MKGSAKTSSEESRQRHKGMLLLPDAGCDTADDGHLNAMFLSPPRFKYAQGMLSTAEG